METIENRGVSEKNQEFSTDFKENQANSVKTVEKCVENVENRVYPNAEVSMITNELINPDGNRQAPTADLAKELA